MHVFDVKSLYGILDRFDGRMPVTFVSSMRTDNSLEKVFRHFLLMNYERDVCENI